MTASFGMATYPVPCRTAIGFFRRRTRRCTRRRRGEKLREGDSATTKSLQRFKGRAASCSSATKVDFWSGSTRLSVRGRLASTG